MFDATVVFRDGGFSIDHDIRRPPFDIHDDYEITADRPVKTIPR